MPLSGRPKRGRDAMTGMEDEDRERPPAHFGDYPHGAYWSAFPPAGSADDDEAHYSVEGSDLRIMWDEGAGPLWTTEEGLLPDDPEWMKRALGLSDLLVAELLTWLHDMNAAQQRYLPTTELDERALQLAARLQGEVGSRFEVRYHR